MGTRHQVGRRRALTKDSRPISTATYQLAAKQVQHAARGSYEEGRSRLPVSNGVLDLADARISRDHERAEFLGFLLIRQTGGSTYRKKDMGEWPTSTQKGEKGQLESKEERTSEVS